MVRQMRDSRGGAGASVDDSVRNEILSSRTRLRLAELMSTRPRSLRELAKLTSLTVPGVLRHLDALAKVGVIREERISSKELPIRKTYSLKGVKVADFSVGDISITEITKTPEGPEPAEGANLEWLASDVMVSRRRAREKAKRLARAIEDFLENEAKLARAVASMGLEPDERLIVLTVFTEETNGEAAKILESEGMVDSRMPIERAIAKAKGFVDR